MKKLLSLCLGIALLGATAASPAAAAGITDIDAVTRVVESISNPEVDYNEVNNDLNKTESILKSKKVTAQELSAAVKFLADNRSKIVEAKKQIEKELNFVQKRIDALGPAPQDGASEPEIIAEKRKEFNSELDLQKSRMAEADILLARIDELDNVIISVRNRKLLGSLLERQSPLINPTVFWESTEEFVDFGVDMLKSPVNWFAELNTEGRDFVKTNALPVILIFLLSLWLGIYLRLFIMRHFGYRQDLEHIRYGRKVVAAVCVAVGYGVIPAFILGSLLLWMVSTEIMTVGFFGLVLNAFLYFSLYVILVRAVARVIFAPYNEKWRLVNVSTPKAKSVTQALYASIMIVGFVAYLEYVAQKANYPLELISYITAISAAVKAFCMVWVIKRLLWEKDDEAAADDEPGAEEGAEDEGISDDEEITPAFKITFLSSLFAIAVFGLSLFGYPYLSDFIFNHLLLSILVIGIFAIIRKSINELLQRLLLLNFWVTTFKLRRRILRKLNFWSGLLIDPILAIMMILSLLSLWGVSTDILLQTTVKLLTGFTVGGVEISIISIIIGIIVFLLLVGLERGAKRRLMDNILSKMDIDEGLKHSLASGFGFLGFTVAALLSFAIMGGNLTNFALIAGALSVGVGLGLQNVVNNFVSGIILLFERPIKVGDWVIINGEEGKIKQINIRSTEVETFKRSSLIIPNASLLSTTVTNLTHGNNWARYAIKVGVAYGSDTQRVRDVLLECAQNHRRVLKKPEPYVLFQDFGSSSLDFELRFYVSDIWAGWTVPSDLRFEINRRFAEEGIEIPFQQMVVHHGSEVSKETQSQFYALKNKGKANADK